MLCYFKVSQNLLYRWQWQYSGQIQKGKNSMKRFKNYLICYDISDEKRVVKLAKYLEKVAFRIQFSIFLLHNATDAELMDIVENIMERIDQNNDDVRIYTIKNSGLKAGKAVDLDDPFTII